MRSEGCSPTFRSIYISVRHDLAPIRGRRIASTRRHRPRGAVRFPYDYLLSTELFVKKTVKTEEISVECSQSEPEFLYRFFSIERAEPLLAEGKIFYPSPKDFNDPFDCKPHFVFKASPLKRMRYARELVAVRGRNLSKYERKLLVKQGLSVESYHKAHERFLENLGKRVGVLSLSAKFENILLWSHYAQSHTGVCIEFLRSGLLETSALKVHYSADYPELDFFKVDGAMERGGQVAREAEREAVEKISLTKSVEWEYESEWRIIDSSRGRGSQQFPTHLIKRVLFGCRTNSADREKVNRGISVGPANPTLCQAKTKRASFGLEFDVV